MANFAIGGSQTPTAEGQQILILIKKTSIIEKLPAGFPAKLWLEIWPLFAGSRSGLDPAHHSSRLVLYRGRAYKLNCTGRA